MIAWHAGLMLLAWAVLMPAGFLVARFYKVTPSQDWPRRLDNPFWFISHRRLGYAVAVLGTIGIACIGWIGGVFVLWPGAHAVTGWLIFGLGWLQIVGAWFRGTHGGPVDPFTRQPRPQEQWPGDHFSLTGRRIFFEYSHKAIGYLIVPLCVWQIGSGLDAAGASAWLWVLVGIWALLVMGVFTALQRAGKCIDTYQAIWGLDATLPGYRRKPIGWGIRRVRGIKPPA